MLGDVGERKVARPEGVQEDDRRDGGGAKGGVERVSRGVDKAPPTGVRAKAAADRRIDGERERECERGAT